MTDWCEANSREIQAITYVGALDFRLADSEKALEARLKCIPNGWRDYRCAETIVTNLLDKLYGTLPPKNLLHFRKLVANSEVIIRPKPAVPLKGDDYQFITTEALELLVNGAMANSCAMCLKEGSECKKCELRKALLTVVPPVVVDNKFGCPYKRVAIENEMACYI